MTARKAGGIAADASDYEDFPDPEEGPPDGRRRIPDGMQGSKRSKSSQGIADDASFFEDLLAENTGEARTLDSAWNYEKDGAVFGPVKPKELLQMLYEGEIGADTKIGPEEAELKPLRHFGVFRGHVSKAKARLAQLEADRQQEKKEARARIFRRVGLTTAAGVLLVVASGAVVYFVRQSREAAALEEKEKLEAALRNELAALDAAFIIEPPLMPLVDEPAAPPPGTPHKGRKGRRRRAKARLSAGSATGTGDLTRSEVMQGVGSVFGGMKRCILQQLKRDAEAVPSQIVLTFVIKNDGKVKNVSITDRFMRAAPIRGCFEGQLAKVRWRKFKGEVRNVEYPISIGRR